MTVASDLAAAFAETELSVPVLMVRTGTVTRGFLDRGVAIANGAGVEAEHASDVLHIIKGSLAGHKTDDELRIGAEDADAIADADPLFVIRGAAAVRDDGTMEHLVVAEETL